MAAGTWQTASSTGYLQYESHAFKPTADQCTELLKCMWKQGWILFLYAAILSKKGDKAYTG